MRIAIGLCAVSLLMFAAWPANARPDGSFGSNCQSCHGGGGPTDPPTDPPSDPPTDPPSDPPTDPPSTNVSILGVEIATKWDYANLNGVLELNYVFLMTVETDPSVVSVEILTPAGTVLSIVDEPLVVEDNVQTRFRDEGEVLVWEYEARATELGELDIYGHGAYQITAYTNGEPSVATVEYAPGGSQSPGQDADDDEDEADEDEAGDDEVDEDEADEDETGDDEVDEDEADEDQSGADRADEDEVDEDEADDDEEAVSPSQQRRWNWNNWRWGRRGYRRD